MVELADIFRQAGPAYRKAFEGRMLPSHERAMRDIVRCRTPALGGCLYRCDECGNLDFAYHSCRNRHCPKCQHDQTERWLLNLRSRLLPGGYYLITFTVPDKLWRRIRSNQRIAYSILMRQAAAAVLTLCADPKWIGARPAILAVLHTWSRTLTFHPHVHILVTAGGLSEDGAWLKTARPGYLLPGWAISKIFRAKVRDAFKEAGLDHGLCPHTWTRPWTVHVKHAGDGQHVAEYLSRYVKRVAITNPRIERFDGRSVTFRYIHSRTGKACHQKLTTQRFIARFLQHVLPRGFTKVRYYGLFSSGCRKKLDQARELLEDDRRRALETSGSSPTACSAKRPVKTDGEAKPADSLRSCPHCQRGRMVLVERQHALAPARAPP